MTIYQLSYVALGVLVTEGIRWVYRKLSAIPPIIESGVHRCDKCGLLHFPPKQKGQA